MDKRPPKLNRDYSSVTGMNKPKSSRVAKVIQMIRNIIFIIIQWITLISALTGVGLSMYYLLTGNIISFVSCAIAVYFILQVNKEVG